MATFDETQITDLAEILGTNSDALDQHLDFYAPSITEADKTKVLARLVEWQALDGEFLRVHPNVENLGAEIKPAEQKSFLVTSIANLLHWGVVGMSQTSLVRG